MSQLFHRLKSLYVLNVVMQYQSFSQAAHQLHMTQSAVSQHIKQLEAEVGMLFVRSTRSVEPTELALSLCDALNSGFALLEKGWEQARYPGQQSLTISLLPSFASNWLLPRLPSFSALHPEIELRLSLSTENIDFNRCPDDAGIRYGFGNYPDLIVRHLMDDYIFPVMSPLLAVQISLDDLMNFTLIRDDEEDYCNWEGWLRLAGCPYLKPKRFLTISDSSLGIKAAIAGQGIALTRQSLIIDELKNGTLVKPFTCELKSPFSYYLVIPERSRNNPLLRVFSEWLMAQLVQVQQTNVPLCL